MGLRIATRPRRFTGAMRRSDLTRRSHRVSYLPWSEAGRPEANSRSKRWRWKSPAAGRPINTTRRTNGRHERLRRQSRGKAWRFVMSRVANTLSYVTKLIGRTAARKWLLASAVALPLAGPAVAQAGHDDRYDRGRRHDDRPQFNIDV